MKSRIREEQQKVKDLEARIASQKQEFRVTLAARDKTIANQVVQIGNLETQLDQETKRADTAEAANKKLVQQVDDQKKVIVRVEGQRDKALARLATQEEKVQDITEQVRTEQALRESEEKYRRLVQNSIDGIAVVQEREIRFANPALLKMFGCQNKDEMIGHVFADFVSPEHRALMGERARARARGEDVSSR